MNLSAASPSIAHETRSVSCLVSSGLRVPGFRKLVGLVLGLTLACWSAPAARAAAMFTGYIAPPGGYYTAGETIDIGVQYSELVVVSGTPRLRVQAGTHTLYANYLGGSESDLLTFRYTVPVGVNAPFLVVAALDLNGGSIVNLESDPAGAPSVTPRFDITIDTAPPTVVSLLRAHPLERNTGSGTVIYRVTFSEWVVNAAPAAFNLLRSGSATGTIAWVRGDRADWYVAVTGISGQGSLGLEVRQHVVSDYAGNQISAFTSGERYFCLNTTFPHAWGYGTYGQLGNLTNSGSTTPVPLYAATSSPLAGHTLGHLASGFTHSYGLARNGRLFAWGDGVLGQIGNGYNQSYNYPESVKHDGGLAGQQIIATAAGGAHGLALSASGLVFAWGNNSDGQLGRGNTIPVNEPVYVADTGTPLQGKTIVALAAGYRHSLALDTSGQVYAWGDNAYGQLGDNSTVDAHVPVAVSTSGALAGKRVVAITAGFWFSAALTADGQVITWGMNNTGQLGIGTNANSLIPVAVTGGAQVGRTALEISAGGAHLLARNSDGSLTAWGNNPLGQLGNGTTTPATTPVLVTTAVLGSAPIARISTGDAHSLALTADGRLFSWGYNNTGQLALGTNPATTIPQPTPVPATSPESTYAAIGLDQGHLGNHSLALFQFRTGAHLLTGPAAGTYGTGAQLDFSLDYPENVAVASSPYLIVSLGNRLAHATLVAHNGYGRLTFRCTVQPGDYAPDGITLQALVGAERVTDARGLGVNTVLPSNPSLSGVRLDARPPQPLEITRAQPHAVTEAAAVTTASALIYHLTFDKVVTGVDATDFTLATTGTTTGTVANILGTGDSRFVVVTGVTGSGALRLDLKSTGTGIADTLGNPLAGGFTSGQCYVHLGATALFGWGYNNLGQLGISNGGYGDSISSPSIVPAGGALYGKTVAALATGFAHSLALCTDGTLVAWGDNNFGQLGCAHPDSSSATPVAVTMHGALSGKTVIAIAAGATHCLALTNDGFLYAWGRNDQGQLGTGTGTDGRDLPTAVYAAGALAGESVIALAAGSSHSLALTASGRLFAWGSDTNDQLGNGSFGSSLTPTPVDLTVPFPGERIVAIAAGSLHSLALGSGGHVYAWGSNSSGQVGDNGFVDVESPVLIEVSSALPGYNAVVVALAAGEAHSAVLTSDGGLFTWGANDRRQLGDGSSASLSRTPVAVDLFAFGGDAPVALTAGNRHNLARTATGLLFGWGNNYTYPLTNSVGSISPTPALLESGILGTAEIATLASGCRADHSLVLANTAGDPLALIEHWRLRYFNTPFATGSAADAADPDADGRTNFIEYATGTDPLNADSGPVAALALSGTGATRRLTLTFNRIADPSITYTVEASATLATGSWTTIIPPATPRTGPVTVTDPEFMGAYTRRFLRLKIVR